VGKIKLNSLFVWLTMILWSAIAILIAAAARKNLLAGASEFFIGGRRLRGFVSGMTYAATTYSAFMLVGLVGLTYKTGVGALGFEMTYLIFTVLLLVTFGPRFWLVGNWYDYITPPELLANRYHNKWVGVVAAAISFLMLIPYASVQLMGMGFLVSGITGGEITFMTGVLLMVVLSGFTAFWAGMRSVAWTDAFQAVTMIVTSLAALAYTTFHFFGSPIGFARASSVQIPDLVSFTWEPAFFVGLTLPWAFFALTNPQVSQRMYVPDSAVSLRRMIIYFAVFGFIYTIISTLFGLQAAMIMPGLENPDKAMPLMLSKVPPAMGLIIFVGIFAAATSTLGSIALTLGSMFARDIAKQVRPEISESAERLLGQISIVVLLFACIVFAWFRPGLITVVSSMASGGLLVMAPAIIGVFFWRRATAAGALCSMLTGGVVTAVMYLAKIYPLGWWPCVWGGGLTLILFVAVSAVTTPPGDAAAFISRVEKELDENNFRLWSGK
jgi:SSS family solute:Na+ symporter